MHVPNIRHPAALAYDQESFLLHNLLENIPEAIYFKDIESRFILINHAAARLFKLASPEGAIGKTDFDIFTKEHARAAFEDEREIIRTGIPIVGKEERETWADGSISWAMTTKLPLRNTAGAVIGTFGISRDITERKRAMEQIAEQAMLIEIVPDAVIVTDLESNILFWNKGAENVYGWTALEVHGQKTYDLFYSKEADVKSDELRQAVLTKGSCRGEVCHLTRNQKKLTVESHQMMVRDADGFPKTILIVNTDITEKKKVEAQLLRAQRMESIGFLAGGIAHDFNNILAPILIATGLLRGSVGKPEAQILDTVDSSVIRGAAIVKQLLHFARGAEGERSKIQFGDLIKEVEQVLKNTFPKNIELNVIVPSNLWTFTGDPTQLYQVLLNLCVNARDAMPMGGKLVVTVENRHLDELHAMVNAEAKVGPYVILSVEDSGVGMDSEILEKVFEPFFTTKEVGKGTGLGLSTTFGIVKSHGGFITVESEPGRGTSFHIFLPIQTLSEELPIQAQSEECPRGNGETILVVDDESSIISVTSQTLQRFGYNVVTASNGAEALAIYTRQHNQIAAIISDLAMPIMDGITAVEAIKRINPDVEIIISSGRYDDSSLAKATDAGVKHFLKKPWSAATLLRALDEVFRPSLTEKSFAVTR